MARDTRAKLEGLANKLEPQLARAFLYAIARVRSRVKLGQVAELIARGDGTELAEALAITPSDAAAISEQVRVAYVAGGDYEAAKLPASVFRFDGINLGALQAMSGTAAQLVTNINEAQRQAVYTIMRDGLVNGRNPRAVALDIVGRVGTNGRRQGGIIGLNGPQTEARNNMRKALLEGDWQGYKAKTLRDKRFDKTVYRAIQEKRTLSSEAINKIVGRYDDKLLRRRGETIGREAIGHLNAGRLESMRQVVDQGVVEDRDVVKVWHSTGDARQRDTHGAMNGQTKRLGELFVSPSGARFDGPQDTSHGAGPEETINCRCWMETRVDFIAARRRQRAAQRG